jgi:hypothetical protein
VLIVITLVGVAVGVALFAADQRDRSELTEDEFHTAVHEAAETLDNDPSLPDLDDLSMVIEDAITDAEEPVSYPTVSGIEDDESPTPDADSSYFPRYSEYEISADDVTSAFCMHRIGFAVTEGPC